MADIPESETESFYMEYDPLNRSEGEIGGDIFMQGLKNFKQPEPGVVKKTGKGGQSSKLGQTQGYMDNVPNDGGIAPLYESNEGPI